MMKTSLARAVMSDEEWKFFERFTAAGRASYGRKANSHRLVFDGIYRVARTSAPRRDLVA
ncbi:transposase [Loktanella fryxellensis]|uniref:transposase n=1 Tax=Loktanella fryxellensis TaxID=245187 RepID=UPI0015A6E076